jgi:hypothetical protein
MSSTSKRPRAPLSEPGEVVTNWKIVRIVVSLAMLAAGCVALSAWSSCPRDEGRTPKVVGNCEGEAQPVPREKVHELRREVVVYGRRAPTLVEEIDIVPKRPPGPPVVETVVDAAPEPLEAVSPSAQAAAPALIAERSPRPPMLRTLREGSLLQQLGFETLDARLDRLSASAEGPLDGTLAQRVPKVVDIDLDTEKGTVEKLHKLVEEFAPPPRSRGTVLAGPAGTKKDELSAGASSQEKHPSWAKDTAPADAWLDLIAKRADLQGLPYRKGRSCQLSSDSALVLHAISQNLDSDAISQNSVEFRRRRKQSEERAARSGNNVVAATPGNDFVAAIVGVVEELYSNKKFKAHGHPVDADQVVPALVQMMQAGSLRERGLLVEALASIQGRNATTALAQRALFDLSRDTRELAVKALAQRPREEIRPHLLAGLCYPWAAISEHAAAALVATGDRGAVKELTELLDEPDPVAPYVNSAGKWAVRELARVNHLRNCFLCHAPSLSRTDPVRGLVPVPGQPLPDQYYQDELPGNFVRADVTYLRQDFSLVHPVEKPDRWPKE